MIHADGLWEKYGYTENGLLTESAIKTGLKYTYGYDALERRTTVTDPRTGTSITHYNSKGQVDWVEDAASNRTSVMIHRLSAGVFGAISGRIGSS